MKRVKRVKRVKSTYESDERHCPERKDQRDRKERGSWGDKTPVFFTNSERNYGNKGENEENKRSSDQRVTKVKRGKSTYESDERRCPKRTDRRDQKERGSRGDTMPIFFTDSEQNYGNKCENEQNERSSDQQTKGWKEVKHTDPSKAPILPFFPLAEIVERAET